MPSILTLNKNRNSHLQALISGLQHSSQAPRELIIVEMGEPTICLPPTIFPIKTIHLPNEGLPLAKARNLAAANAASNILLFLDVDCIVASNFVQIMSQAVREYQQIISCEVLYLPPEARNITNEERLRQLGKPHAARPFPRHGYHRERNPGLFWSLAFGLTAESFNHIGGFCEDYTGYGAEDTDFGFRATSKHVEHWLTGDTRVYHQYHNSQEPPYQHFHDIITNAKVFYKKWHKWPMGGWLAAFAEQGLIKWQPKDKDIIILNSPYTI